MSRSGAPLFNPVSFGWTRFIDLPKPSEHEELGLKYTHSFKDGTVKLECAVLGLVFEGIGDAYLAETIANSELGDKLAGWRVVSPSVTEFLRDCGS